MKAQKSKNRKEDIYILRRRIQALANSLCFYACRIFPVDFNLVSVCIFEGKSGFGCNPKYIVEEMHKRNKNYKFVWFVNKDALNKPFPDYIQKIPNTLWNRALWLSKSGIWIDNYRKPYGTVKRKSQYYLNTWHGAIAIKPLGLLRGDGFSRMAYLVSKNDSDMIDDFLIDSEWCDRIAEKAFLFSKGCTRLGMPRLDCLYGDRTGQCHSVRKMLGLRDDARLVMYAPTFRETAHNGRRSVHSELFSLDFDMVIKAFEEKFKGEWYLCLRVHPQLAAGFDGGSQDKGKIINVSSLDDMYELLSGMDAYISDYSSAAFEAAYGNIPVFIYADDIAEYSSGRGGLLWNILNEDDDGRTTVDGMDVQFPFDIARNNEQLQRLIKDFDSDKYQKRIDQFKADIGLVFDGRATERIVDLVEERISENGKAWKFTRAK